MHIAHKSFKPILWRGGFSSVLWRWQWYTGRVLTPH